VKSNDHFKSHIKFRRLKKKKKVLIITHFKSHITF